MLIIALDSVSFLAAAAALIFLGAGWNQIAGKDIRILLTALLTLTLFYSACLWIEWTGLMQTLDRYEDFAGALIPMFWAFVFYAYIQQAHSRDLRQSEENLRITLNSIGDGVIAATPEGGIIRMNPMAEQLTGWKFKEAMGNPLSEVFRIVNAKSGEPVSNPVDTVIETGVTTGLANHTMLISRDGEKYQIADSAAPIRNAENATIGVVLVFRDVTEEYRLREKIAENRERMELALKGADLGTWDWNVATGKVTFNERWAEMLGYSKNELTPHISTWEKLIHPEDFPGVMEAINAHLSGRTESYEKEHRLKHKSGHWVWVLDKGRVIEHDEAGNPLRACGTHLDITENKQAEKERQHLQNQLNQTRKMESIGRLAGGVAHDLNNLLSPIIGYSELLLDSGDPDDKRRAMAEEILQAGSRARDLVRRLLAFGRKQTLKFKPVNISKAVEESEKLLQRSIPEDIEIRINASAGIRPVMADTGQIQQVIMNLAINATDAMPDGGLLTIETAMAELDEADAASHPDLEAGQYVMLSVSDTGCGMDQETRENIFEPFFSTKGEQGTGLGLATVFGIIRQHGGGIRVYSEPGKGTVFRIYLPARGKEVIKEKPEEKAPGEIKGAETILLAEDDEQVRHLARSILTRHGYTVLEAKDSKDALAQMGSHAGPVHLLLTDVVMPGINGRELYEKAARKQPGLKVLYMSGYTDNVIARRGVLEDGVHFIHKPFSIRSLAAKVREILDENGHDR